MSSDYLCYEQAKVSLCLYQVLSHSCHVLSFQHAPLLCSGTCSLLIRPRCILALRVLLCVLSRMLHILESQTPEGAVVVHVHLLQYSWLALIQLRDSRLQQLQPQPHTYLSLVLFHLYSYTCNACNACFCGLISMVGTALPDDNPMLCCLMQTLSTLDNAFNKLGFIHNDMRVSNVMEHHLEAQPLYPRGFGQRQKKHAVGVLTGPKSNTFDIPGKLT